MIATRDTSHFEISLLNDFAPLNMALMSFALETFHPDRSFSNDAAPENIPPIVTARDTFHLETSPLNDLAPSKISLMSVTADTSHSSIGPCGVVEQSPTGESRRHLSTAAFSSALDLGANAAVIAIGVVV